MSTFIKNLTATGLDDIALVGRKNAALGELVSRLALKGRPIPPGFVTTTQAFSRFMQYNDYNDLAGRLRVTMEELDRSSWANLSDIGSRARQLIYSATMPEDLADAIASAYAALPGKESPVVVVRNSPVITNWADTHHALHQSYPDVSGETSVIDAVQLCFASLYSNSAIRCREQNGLRHEQAVMCVSIQAVGYCEYPEFQRFLSEEALDSLESDPTILLQTIIPLT